MKTDDILVRPAAPIDAFCVAQNCHGVGVLRVDFEYLTVRLCAAHAAELRRKLVRPRAKRT